MSTLKRAHEGTLLTMHGPENEGSKNIRKGGNNLPVDTV